MKRLLIALITLAFFATLPGVALGYWLAQDATGSARAAAATLPAGRAPQAVVRAGSSVIVTVPPVAGPVDDYLIRRYPAGGRRAVFAFHCRLDCLDVAVADGRWVYTATPELGRWRGRESPAGRPVRVDTTAPVLTITSPTASNNVRPVLTGTAGVVPGDARAVTVRLLAGSRLLVQRNVAVVGGRWQLGVGPLPPQHSYTVSVRQLDEAGNVGQARSEFVLDTIAPSVWLAPVDWPTFAGAAGAARSSSTTSADSTTVDVQIFHGTTLVQTLTAGRTGRHWTVTGAGLATGDYTARARQRDAAGNVSYSNRRGFSVDATPPAVTVSVPAYVNTPAPVVTGTAGTAPGDHRPITVQVLADGIQLTRQVVTSRNGAWTAQLSGLTGNRRYQVLASQVDAAGNVGSATASFVLDTVAPLVLARAEGRAISGSAGTIAGSDTTSPDANTVQVLVYAQNELVATVDSPVLDGTFTTLLTGLAPGDYQVLVQQSDAAGNLGRTQPIEITVPPQG